MSKKMVWKRISDGLPPEDKDHPKHFSVDCIATDGENLYTGWFEDGRFYGRIVGFSSMNYIDSITHWMPFPDLPKEKERICKNCSFWECKFGNGIGNCNCFEGISGEEISRIRNSNSTCSYWAEKIDN